MTRAAEPRLLLLHGFMSGGLAWRQVAAELGDDCALAMPDLAGNGDGPAHAPTFEHLLAHLLPIAERFRPTHIVGHSMGGIAALGLNRRLASPVARIGVIGIPVYRDRADGLQELHKRGALHKTILANDALSHLGCRAVYGLRRLWSPAGPTFVPLQPRDHMVAAFKHSWHGHKAIETIVFNGLVPALAVATDTPVSALHGGRDPSARLDRLAALALAQGWPLHIAPTGTHQLPIERPAMVARWIREEILGGECRR